MFGAAPLLRTATFAATSVATSSRIPHLAFHILQRRAGPISSRPLHRCAIAQQQRPQSTSVNFEDYDSLDTRSEHSLSSTSDVSYRTTGEQRSGTGLLPSPDQAKEFSQTEDINFYTILEQQSPDLILLAFFDESIGDPFIKHAPDDLFNKALLSIEPSYFIERYTQVHRHIKHRDYENFLSRGIKTVEERLDSYNELFERILTLRHEGQNKLSLAACKHILKWAGSLGNETLALRVFGDVMKEDEIEPDVECYNYFMQAAIWAKGHEGDAKFGYRALPRHREIRASKLRPPKLSGFRTADSAKGSVGIRAEMLHCFRQLCEDKHTANELTFVNLMTAMGHEGDIKGVVSILKSVWNIDLGMLEKFDEDEVESPTFYEEGSPLRPSETLLFALAHIFGSNNDARTAWLLVDYVSRNYALKIPQHVWTELLEWYMILSIRRSGAEKAQGSDQGKIKLDAFTQLVQVMGDEPHNMKMDAVAYYLQSRVGRDQRNLENQVKTIQGLQEVLSKSMTNMRQSMAKLTQIIQQMQTHNLQHLWDNTQFPQLRQDFILLSLQVEACYDMMQHATYQYLVRYRYWAGARKLTHWERRKLPEIVEEFGHHLPYKFSYRTSTGMVTLRDPTWQRGGYDAPTYKTMIKFRQLLDTEDHDTLLQGVLQMKEWFDPEKHNA